MKLKTQGTRDNIYLVLLIMFSLSAITAPFWHIFFEKGADDGLFGFSSTRSFLYTFGTHYILFGLSMFTFWVIGFIPDKNLSVKRLSYMINILFCSVALYYLFYVFIDSNSPYPDYVYEIANITCSLFISFLIFKLFNNYRIKRLQEKKEADEFVENAFSFINEVNKSLIQ